MKLISVKDYDAMARRAANLLLAQVAIKPNAVLGLATGSTMLGVYKYMVAAYRAGDADFSAVRSVNLDEYFGLTPTHEQSYRHYMEENLFGHVNIKKENTRLPSGVAQDVLAECAAYDAHIANLGGIDTQLLGLGHDGHIGFNEPADMFVSETHLVDLTDETITANARLFANKEDVPRQALTMGIEAIMKAKRVLLCVSGTDKAEILARALRGAVTPRVPASVLQLHSDLTIVADEEALGKLN